MLRKIKKYFLNIKIQKRINKAKCIHIMFNDKFNKPFVDFLNRNFNPEEHIILCKKWFRQFPMPKGDNVIEVQTIKDFKFDKNEKIICHSLFDTELINYLYKHCKMLKEKAYWMIWGGDLYNAPKDEMNDFVRANFKAYISDTDGDCGVAMEKYNSTPQTYNAGYTFPITKEMIEEAKKSKTKKDYIQIQINNSADDTTLEMLDILSKFKDENIKITTILSYGKMQFKDEIIKKGQEIFKDKFEYIDEYFLPCDYAKKLAQNDILILNQNRQQGVGNTLVSLYLKNKVYIRTKYILEVRYRHIIFLTNKILKFLTLKAYLICVFLIL